MWNVPRLEEGSRRTARRCSVSLSIIHIPSIATYQFAMEVPKARLRGYAVAVDPQPCRYLNHMYRLWCIIYVICESVEKNQ